MFECIIVIEFLRYDVDVAAIGTFSLDIGTWQCLDSQRAIVTTSDVR